MLSLASENPGLVAFLYFPYKLAKKEGIPLSLSILIDFVSNANVSILHIIICLICYVTLLDHTSSFSI